MIKSAGVDTWSVCWYLEAGGPGVRAMEGLASKKANRSLLLEETVRGHVVGWFPGSRLLFAEGHPSHAGLAAPASLPRVLEELQEELNDRGILPPRHKLMHVGGYEGVARPTFGGSGFAGVRRLDSTMDLAFDDGLTGLAVLTGVASMPLPRTATKVQREVGTKRVETVHFLGHGGRRVLGRYYDKGVESGLADRGTLIRPEDQRRYTAETRLPVEAVASTSYVRDSFVKRFRGLYQVSKGVKVTGVLKLAQYVGQLEDEGVLTPRQAVTALGHLVLDAAGAQRQSRATVARHRALCRKHGLVLADGVLDEVEVDLGVILEETLDTDAWDRADQLELETAS